MYIEDKDLVAFFLRTQITDPRNRISSEATQVEALSADTIVSVTSSNSISHIDNVTLDAVSLTAFVDYIYDIKNRKIIFFQEQTGTLSFEVFTGNNWIYADTPRKQDLTDNSFPRISIIYVSRPSEILGNFDSCEVINNRFQVDVWTKKDYVADIDVGGYNSKLGDDKLTMYLANTIKNSLKSNAFDLTAKHFRDYMPIESPRLETFNDELNLYNSKLEFFIKSIK